MTISGSRSNEEVLLVNLQNKQACSAGYPPSWISCVISLAFIPKWLPREKSLLLKFEQMYERPGERLKYVGKSHLSSTILKH